MPKLPIRSQVRSSNGSEAARESWRDISPPPHGRRSLTTAGRRSTNGAASINPPSQEAIKPPPTQAQTQLNTHSAYLKQYELEVYRDERKLVIYRLEEATARLVDRTVPSGSDLFAGCRNTAVSTAQAGSMRIDLKQHGNVRQSTTSEHHVPVISNTRAAPVPEYIYHPVLIAKNHVAPATALIKGSQRTDFANEEDRRAFSKHVADLKAKEKKRGYASIQTERLIELTAQMERAYLFAPYLKTWLACLGVPPPAVRTLDLPDDAEERDDDKKHAKSDKDTEDDYEKDETDSSGEEGSLVTATGDMRAQELAEIFRAAFQSVFCEGKDPRYQVPLKHVVEHAHLGDDSITRTQGHRMAGLHDPGRAALKYLVSYTWLGCLICHAFACEHGEYNDNNFKRPMRLHKLELLLPRRRRLAGAKAVARDSMPLERSCSCATTSRTTRRNEGKAWSDHDSNALLSTCVAVKDHPDMALHPACVAAATLSRSCEQVRQKMRDLNLPQPQPQPQPPSETRAEPERLPYYDRHQKRLMGNWEKELKSHNFTDRELVRNLGCFHDGPCGRKCPCRKRGLLCEKYCACSVASCAFKFTGCACKASGENCVDRPGARTCICVQLNRECDPDLCGACGVVEQADPWKYAKAESGAERCRNCDLQTMPPKALVKGESQIEGAGMGLYIAESARGGEFVAEYIGEWLVHDEGEIRSLRRQGHGTTQAPSYLFSVLPAEGFELDAAAYGNMTRFANSAPAPAKSKRGKPAPASGAPTRNLLTKIFYVNGEFRIKLTAARAIQAGEELFFDYGHMFFKGDGQGKSSNTPRSKMSKDAAERIAKSRIYESRMSVAPEQFGQADDSDEEATEPGTLARGRENPRKRKHRHSLLRRKDSSDDSQRSVQESPARPRRTRSSSKRQKLTADQRRPEGRGDSERRANRSRADDSTNGHTSDSSSLEVPASWELSVHSSNPDGSQEHRKTRGSARTPFPGSECAGTSRPTRQRSASCKARELRRASDPLEAAAAFTPEHGGIVMDSEDEVDGDGEESTEGSEAEFVLLGRHRLLLRNREVHTRSRQGSRSASSGVSMRDQLRSSDLF